MTYLEGITVAVLGHLANDPAAVAKLAHLAAAPGVEAAFLASVATVVHLKELKVASLVGAAVRAARIGARI